MKHANSFKALIVTALSIVYHSAMADSCIVEIGAQAAQTLVQQCKQVSSSTRPPCNANNNCQLMREEIEDSCKRFHQDPNAPAFCKPPKIPSGRVQATLTTGGGVDDLSVSLVLANMQREITAYCDGQCGDWFVESDDETTSLRDEMIGAAVMVTLATERSKGRVAGLDNDDQAVFIKDIRLKK